MREILFRGKRIDNGEWAKGYLVKQFGVYKIYDDSKEQDFGEWIHEVDSATVGQFTGLHDFNGRNIFEGDVVRMHYFFENHDPYTLGAFEDESEVIGIVRISPFGTYTETETSSYDWGDYLQEPSEELEIIDNIHDKEVSP